MYWILATGFIVIALLVPRLRPLGVIGCIVLGALLGWGMVQRLRGADPPHGRAGEQRGQPSSPATLTEAMPIAAVAAEELRLMGGGAPFELRGRIVNKAPERVLKSVTIRVTRRDCYEGAVDPSGCAKLWQDERWIALNVPPLQSREFVETVWMHGTAPRSRGTLQDTFEVIAATGVVEDALREQN